MNWNLIGSIYESSSIKIAHFVPTIPWVILSKKDVKFWIKYIFSVLLHAIKIQLINNIRKQKHWSSTTCNIDIKYRLATVDWMFNVVFIEEYRLYLNPSISCYKWWNLKLSISFSSKLFLDLHVIKVKVLCSISHINGVQTTYIYIFCKGNMKTTHTFKQLKRIKRIWLKNEIFKITCFFYQFVRYEWNKQIWK